MPDLVKLNANENPYPPSPAVADAVAGAVSGLRLYCDLTEADLCSAIAQQVGLPADHILCGNGSDENLLLAIRAFCDGQTPLAFADITYSFYPVLCQLMGVPAHILPVREDFTLDLSAYYGLGETIVIANPNAPTSLLAPVAEIEEVIRRNPDHIVIVDEAYVDFAGEGASCLPLVPKYDNLIVVRTFSKSRSLAGARLGFCAAQPALIADMNRIKFSYSPYNISSLNQAAGAAAMGLVPFASSFAMFAAGRAFEQVRNSIGYPHLNVKIGATHGGISVGEDGASHQCCEDFGLMSSIPGMVVMSPADDVEARAMVRAAYLHEGPAYMRFGRAAVPVFHGEDFSFEIGKGETLRDGKDVAIIANGLLVTEALTAAEELAKEGIEAMVINMATIKPLNEALVLAAAKKCGKIITAEEHSVIGGLGEAVCSALSKKLPTPVKCIGVNDEFGHSGSASALLEAFGLSAEHILEVAKHF